MRVVVLALPMLAACASMSLPQGELTGTWGGPHASITFQGGLAQLDYDCASGTIDQPVVPAPDGRFQAEGTYLIGHGGPVRVGQIFITRKARYRGTVVNGAMELTTILEDGTVIGPFTLQRGAEPQLTRCL